LVGSGELDEIVAQHFSYVGDRGKRGYCPSARRVDEQV
jgi:hypothetical protein